MLISSVKFTPIKYSNKPISNFSKVNNQKCSSDTVDLNTHKKNISFCGYKGYENYGTEVDRTNCFYNPKLTPEKIDSIIKDSSSIDRGLFDSMIALNNECNNTSKVMNSIGNIALDFNNKAGVRGKQLLKMNPELSRIPYIGLITTIFRSDFKEDLKKYSKDVVKDWDEILEIYFKRAQGVKDNFLLTCDELSNKVNLGKKIPKDEYIEGIAKGKNNIVLGWKNLNSNIIVPITNKMQTYESKIYDAQDKRQFDRIGRKLCLLISTAGLSELATPFAEVATEVTSDILTGSFADIVADITANVSSDALAGLGSDIIVDIGRGTVVSTALEGATDALSSIVRKVK